MNIFDSYTHDVLTKCIKHKVQFLVVGGYAVNFYGFRRTTGDIDLWIKPDNENKLQIIQVLNDLGIEKSVINQIEKMDFTKHIVFSDGEEPFKIDFMTYISGVNFDEADSKKNMAEIDALNIPFIHLNHLVISKIGTGRPKDSMDVQELQKIDDIRKNKSK